MARTAPRYSDHSATPNVHTILTQMRRYAASQSMERRLQVVFGLEFNIPGSGQRRFLTLLAPYFFLLVIDTIRLFGFVSAVALALVATGMIDGSRLSEYSRYGLLASWPMTVGAMAIKDWLATKA